MAWLSLAIGLLACLIFLSNPLSQLLTGLSPSPPQIRRIPRPAVNESLLALDDWPANLTCPGDARGYSAHLLSRTPLVVYIENFLAPAERAHLLEIRSVCSVVPGRLFLGLYCVAVWTLQGRQAVCASFGVDRRLDKSRASGMRRELRLACLS